MNVIEYSVKKDKRGFFSKLLSKKNKKMLKKYSRNKSIF